MSRDHIRVDLIGSERVKTSTTVDHKAIKCPYIERHSTIGDVIQVYSNSRDSRVMVFCPTKIEANELAMSSCIKISSQVCMECVNTPPRIYLPRVYLLSCAHKRNGFLTAIQ